ncbi:MAG: hypothetical protein ACREYD_12185 [Casimicrobiaceae bacterium]
MARANAGGTGSRPLLIALMAIAIAVGAGACSRSADKTASTDKPELTPTTPSIGPPPAQPAPEMPPKASTVFESSQTPGAPANATNGAPPNAGSTGQGSDPTAKESMSKAEESTAMPKPAQANDHSTLATDGKK